MKKVIILIIMVLLVGGCGEEKECPTCECPSDAEMLLYNERLEQKLIEYGKEIYVNSGPLNSESYEVGRYSANLKYLKEEESRDISEFVNEITKEPCDEEFTTIDMIVYKINSDGTIKYKLIPTLVCD